MDNFKYILILYISAMAENNFPTTGEELDLNNEPPVTGKRKRPLYDSFEVVVKPFGRIVMYIFNHVQ